MNATLHSPGPWKFRGNILRDANDAPLYHITPLEEITIAQDDANRRLIESAPEMVASLRELITALERAKGYIALRDARSESVYHEANGASARAQDLLAKLEGTT